MRIDARIGLSYKYTNSTKKVNHKSKRLWESRTRVVNVSNEEKNEKLLGEAESDTEQGEKTP